MPEGITFEEGHLLLDIVGVPVHGLKRIHPDAGDSVVVYGCGPIGLGTIQTLWLRGLRKIVAVDLVDPRLRAAEEMGAQVAINAGEEDPVERVKEFTDGRKADLVIDAAGTPGAEINALNSVRVQGKVLLMGMNPLSKLEINPNQQILNNETMLIGTLYFTKGEFKEITQLFLRGRDKFRQIISHSFPLEGINEAFHLFMQKRTLRPVIKPRP
jgi:threonine dehydrogenase-like Zn-dependent dehydrogenase